MNAQRTLTTVLIWMASACTERTAFAEPVVQATRVEAQARMDRAIAFFNEGNLGAALAEFMAVHQLAPQPVVRYNIGLVQAAMGRPVEAVDWLEQCLADPATLTTAERDRAAAKLKEQRARVGTIWVTTNIPGTIVEIDSLEAGRTPLTIPLRAASGIHIVTVLATGYAPLRREIKVAGSNEITVHFELLPLQGTIARLSISTAQPEVEIVIDNTITGTTPLSGSLKVLPGQHRIELRRAGYISSFHEVMLADGDAITIEKSLKEDAGWIAANGGSLALSFSETHPMVSVDGQPRGEYQGSMRLAPGLHRLRAERAGFAAVERDVEITSGKDTSVSIRFEPNPDTLVKFKEGIVRRRDWGIVTIVGGEFLAIGGAGLMAGYWLQRQRDCAADPPPTGYRCENDAVGIWAGGLMLGVAVATMISGGVLIGGNADPHRYDVQPSRQKITQLRIRPEVGIDPTRFTISVLGAF